MLREEYNGSISTIISQKRGKFKLQDSIIFWEHVLFLRTMRLIEVDTEAFPPDEFKKQLLLTGKSCIRRSKEYGNIGCYYCDFADNTGQYLSQPISVNFWSNRETGVAYPEVSCVLARNNSLFTPVYPLISRYATLLSHADITLLQGFVNLRADNGIITVKSDNAANAVRQYYNSIFNGTQNAIVDEEMLGIDVASLSVGRNVNVRDLVETRDNLLTAYFNDIGVQSSRSKKGNMVVPEVESAKPRLLLSLNDMVAWWQKAALEAKKMFNIEISVKPSPEIANQFSTSKNEEGGAE